MAEIRPPFAADLDKGIKKTYLNTIFATGDALANCFAVQLYKGNAAYTIPSGAKVKGYFVRCKDDTTIELTGTKSGNVASVTLNGACYNESGQFILTIKVLEDSAVTTVFYGEGSMIVSRTGYTVNPSFEAVEYTRFPVNLLDNSNFMNPVNQRGQTVYTGAGYTIDRWRLTNEYSRLEVTADGIKVSCLTGGTYAYPRQILDGSKLGGKTLTGVWCFGDGTIHMVTGVFPSGSVSADTTFADVTVSGKYRLTLAKLTSGYLSHQTRISAGDTLTLRWAALYEGSYTAETLPPYVPKGYNAELDACHARFYRFDDKYSFIATGFFMQNGSRAMVMLDVPYLNGDEVPTITGMVHLSHPVSFGDGSAVSSTFAVGGKAPDGRLRLECTLDTADSSLANMPCAVQIRDGDYLEISRELQGG